MKKIISLLLILGILLGTSFSFISCDFQLDDFIGSENDQDIEVGDNNGDDVNDGNNTENEEKPDNGGNDEGGSGGEGNDDYFSCDDGEHVDVDDNGYCDECAEYVIVVVDFYAVNDLHGKFMANDAQPGAGALGTYLSNRLEIDDQVVFLASGDMWQGSAESNLTEGLIITKWMNYMGFCSMTLGNHDFDWGEDPIKNNAEIAEFPILAINVYNKSTGERAPYCTPSIMIERGGAKIGIIGAIGDVYSSISKDMVTDVEFKTGTQLNNLVKAEAEKLRNEGADFIVYSVHYGESDIPAGIVDIVFEGHSHSSYVNTDSSGRYHLQSGGENRGVSHAEISINSANETFKVNVAETVANSRYASLEDDDGAVELKEEYSELIAKAYAVLGESSYYLVGDYLASVASELYLEKGLELWGDKYEIVLGGGFFQPRSPYDITAGEISYSDLLSIFPFNNKLTLCSISGSNLLNKFVNSTSYFNTYSEYGESIINNIQSNKTYYVVVDTYTAYYSSNRLTIVDMYDEEYYARDLLAEAVQSGRFMLDGDYDLTSIKTLLDMGKNLASGVSTREYYFVEGTVKSIKSAKYGNIYIEDDKGNSIYVYGLSDNYGNSYEYMNQKLKVGDKIVIHSSLTNYNGTIELVDSVLIEIK